MASEKTTELEHRLNLEYVFCEQTGTCGEIWVINAVLHWQVVVALSPGTEKKQKKKTLKANLSKIVHVSRRSTS